jgi:hypothetical protein
MNRDSVLREYYDRWSKPDGFSATEYLREVELSYQLIFKDDKRARKLYKSRERKAAAAASGRNFDLLLDERCGYTDKDSQQCRRQYDKQTDFPLLFARLSHIQDYVLESQPHDMVTLWKDRRDLLKWYTLWAVLLLTLVTVILALVQIALASAQLSLAFEANRIARESVNNT